MAGSSRGRFVNVEPTPDNFRALWDKLHGLDADLTTANTTIRQQASTITTLTQRLATVAQQAQQALVTAGKATGTGQTNPGTGPGDGGGGGGGGGGDSHPNYYSQVVAAKADLVTEGADLSGPCGAFAITLRAAQYIKPSDPAVGVLDKPDGNNCGGFATDIICFNDGIIYDVLIDGGGANEPAWNFSGSVEVSRYRSV